jgi:MFS family permease
MTIAARAVLPPNGFPPVVNLLLNIAHGIDHMFLLIFATAVSSIAVEFGFSNWADLMPYSVGAFALFGLAALPAGRLAALLTALTQNAWQLAAGLTLLGVFAAIYHPVGIPMLVQGVPNPGAVIGLNGLVGNLGIALAAVLTGLLVKWLGWRSAFAIPGVITIVFGIVFALKCPPEAHSPSKGKGAKAAVQLSPAMLARAFAVMTGAAATSSLLFNFTTNGNSQLMEERFRGLIEDPAVLGMLLGLIYALSSLAQLVVGNLIDRVPLKPLQWWVSILQVPFLIIAAHTQHWAMFAALLAVMIFVFGAVPFTDAMIVRYVDDRLRSRIAGMRLTVAFGISSAAVWMLGPVVKSIGFASALWIMAGIATIKALIVLWLPDEPAVVKKIV